MSQAAQSVAIQVKVVEESLDRIAAHKGVLGYLVLHPKDGRIMSHNGFDNSKEMTAKYAEKLFAFITTTGSVVRSLNHDDDLTFLRMRWRQREIIVAPDLNKEFILIVVQDQNVVEPKVFSKDAVAVEQ